MIPEDATEDEFKWVLLREAVVCYEHTTIMQMDTIPEIRLRLGYCCPDCLKKRGYSVVDFMDPDCD